MKSKLLVMGAISVAAFLFSSCGGSSGGGGDGGGSATVASLSSLPSVDLSNYDYSSSGAAGMMVKAASVTKVQSATGGSSRAGCEVNSQKDNAVRDSKMAQLERCYPEAMEAGGLITIPVDAYTYLKIEVPDDPSQMGASASAAAKVEGEGPGGGPRGGDMYMRLGRFNAGAELHIDTCQDSGSGAAQQGSNTYSASGDTYNVSNTRAQRFGDWNFSMGMDLVFTGVTVTNGVADLGADGSVTADGTFIDDFGRGRMHFAANGATQTNEFAGVFQASFVDEFFGGSQSFLNKVYSQFGGAGAVKTGSAKFYFDGTFPAFPVSMMVPEGMPADQLASFLQFMSVDLGIQLTAQNYQSIYTCPSSECDPDVPDSCRPTLATADASGHYVCEQTFEDKVESFSIAGVVPDLVFTVIANSGSAFFTAVNAYSLAGLSAPAAGSTVAFTRVWDCQPESTWTTINPGSAAATMTSAQLDAMRSKMEACIVIEQDVSGGKGMDQYRCHEEQVQNQVNDSTGCTDSECSAGGMDPWEPVMCEPATETGFGLLRDLWDQNPEVAPGVTLQQWLQGSGGYPYLVNICNSCKAAPNHDDPDADTCSGLLESFKDLYPQP